LNLTNAGASPDKTALIQETTCFGVPSCSSASYLCNEQTAQSHETVYNA